MICKAGGDNKGGRRDGGGSVRNCNAEDEYGAVK